MAYSGGVTSPAGFVYDRAGALQEVNRTFNTFVSVVGDNLLVAAQGAGVRIRVLKWTLQYTTLVNTNFVFRSAATPISAAFQRIGTFNFQYEAFVEHGHFQTNANEALNLNWDFAGVITGINLLWIPTP